MSPVWYSFGVTDEFVFWASNVRKKKIIAVFLMTYEMKQQKSLDVANCKSEGFTELDPLQPRVASFTSTKNTAQEFDAPSSHILPTFPRN